MGSKSITGIVTWLKGWFFTKTEINTKEQALQSQINNKASQADLNTLSSNLNNKLDASAYVVDELLDSSSTNPVQNKVITSALSSKSNTNHRHSTSDVRSTNVLSNLGLGSNTTQTDINAAIDTAIGNLIGADILKVVTTLPTASASTQNALYLLSSNGQYDIYITIEDNGSYSWEELDDDVLSDLSVDWSDIENKPTTFPPSTHTHYASQVTDPSSHSGMGSSANASQQAINTAISNTLNRKLNYDGVFKTATSSQLDGLTDAGIYLITDTNDILIVRGAA